MHKLELAHVLYRSLEAARAVETLLSLCMLVHNAKQDITYSDP